MLRPTPFHGGSLVVSLLAAAVAACSGETSTSVTTCQRTVCTDGRCVFEEKSTDCDSSSSGARPLVPTPSTGSIELEGAIDFAGDTDEILIQLAASSTYEFQMQWLDRTIGPLRIELIAPDLTTVLRTEIADDVVSMRVRDLPAAQYLVRVSEPTGQLSSGTYVLTLSYFGNDDHGDEIASATALANNVRSGTANFEHEADRDVFSFDAVAGHVYKASLDLGANPQAGYTLRFLDANGQDLAHSWEDVYVEVTQDTKLYLETSPLFGFTGAYNWSITESTDDHGDTIADATQVTPSATAGQLSFDYPSDLDLFEINAQVGHLYRASCGADEQSPCDVAVLDAQGTAVVRFGKNSASYVAQSTGKLYFEFSTPHTLGSYAYTIEDLGADDHGNVIAQATPVTAPTASTAASIDWQGDLDVFSVAMQVGQSYRFACTGSNALSTCGVRVFDAAGTELLNVRDIATFTPATAGTYYFEVRAWEPYRSGAYTWELSANADDHGNVAENATSIAGIHPVETAGVIELGGDADVFTFVPTLRSTYIFHCLPDSLVACRIELRSSIGQFLGGNVSSLDAQVRYKANSTTPLTLIVKGDYPSQTGNYKVVVEEFATDDHGDLPETATALTLGTAITGSSELLSDSDYFSVSLTAGTTYTLSMSGIPVAVGVQDEDWFTHASSNSQATLQFTPPATGTYYLRVRPVGQTGNYTLTLQ